MHLSSITSHILPHLNLLQKSIQIDQVTQTKLNSEQNVQECDAREVK